jgi:hypothetical protein
MSKLMSILIAAVFAMSTGSVFAASHMKAAAGDTKDEMKKDETKKGEMKKTDKKEMKKEKKAKAEMKKEEKKEEVKK